MAIVTVEDYAGGKHGVNPAMVQDVTSYQHYDQDKEIPAALRFLNNDGLLEDRHDPEGKALVDEARIETRAIIVFANSSMVVKGTPASVREALGL